MIREEAERMVIFCDRCRVRMDLGPAKMVAQHLRMPSGWLQHEKDRHLCPACARRAISEERFSE